MTADNFCLYLQNRLFQTSQTGGQWYSDTSPVSIPCPPPFQTYKPVFLSSMVFNFHRDHSIQVEREQIHTARELHALEHKTWVWHQLKSNGWSVLNEHQQIFIEELWKSSKPTMLQSYSGILSHSGSLCVYLYISMIISCLSTPTTKRSLNGCF